MKEGENHIQSSEDHGPTRDSGVDKTDLGKRKQCGDGEGLVLKFVGKWKMASENELWKKLNEKYLS